ncbi:MAG TPA: prolyl oligopeptidase family serine peptidase [Pyrinomonadaceae bacterium]|nr:prolyl oligopeptidase family serine peptidase [Pyrinomonadaceae bacterium]
MRKPIVFLLAVVSLPMLLVAALAQNSTIAPTDNLVAEGITPIPASMADDVRRYTEFRSAGITSWHPTRREMLISTRFGDTNQVHLVKFPGGDRRQITFFTERVAGGSFQPTTGDYFLFSKDIGGNEFFQLYRYDLRDGTVTMLTDGKSRNTGGSWSNAGDRVTYTSTRRNGKDADQYVINPTDPKSDRLLLQLEGGGWGIADWSPDDKTLLLFEFVSANESYIWLVDAATGQKTLFTPKGGEPRIAYGGAGFSKDGKGLYVTTDKDSEFQRLAYVDLQTKQYTFLSDHIKWDVDNFDLSDDGKHIAFVTNEDGVAKLHLMDLKTRKEKPVPNLPVGIIGGLRWHKNSRDLGFSLVSARTPSDVYSLDISNDKLERWTDSETGGLNTSTFSEAELVRWKSFDDKTISGFLYMPPAKFTGPRPVVINIHGGPEGQARPSFLGRNNYFLNELGVAILYPNVRGSSGYGKTFLQLDNGFLREDTYKDIGALFDWIKTQPRLDASRILVTGGSYGGHMAFAIATLYNDRIRATLPVVGISNLVSFLERTESYRRDLRRVEYGDERDPKMREFMLKIAPLNHAKNITKPIFIVQGGNDPRVPLNEAEQMVKTIRENGGPVWYLMAKDEGHGFAKKKNQDFQFYATVMFVREHLLK